MSDTITLTDVQELCLQLLTVEGIVQSGDINSEGNTVTKPTMQKLVNLGLAKEVQEEPYTIHLVQDDVTEEENTSMPLPDPVTLAAAYNAGELSREGVLEECRRLAEAEGLDDIGFFTREVADNIIDPTTLPWDKDRSLPRAQGASGKRCVEGAGITKGMGVWYGNRRIAGLKSVPDKHQTTVYLAEVTDDLQLRTFTVLKYIYEKARKTRRL